MDKAQIEKEIVYKAVRSSGKGGQNVNKVSSKVELYFDVFKSEGLSEEEKAKTNIKLNNRLNKEGVMILTSQEDRSQLANKEIVTEKLFNLLENCFKEQKKRRPTKPSKASKLKRLLGKKIHSIKKENRKRDF